MKKGTSGFTIVELLIVVIIIAILASVTVVAFNGVQARARDAQRDTAVSAIRKGLELYKIDTGGYPTPCANVNQDCYVNYLSSYLSPNYLNPMPLPLVVPNSEPTKFFNNGNTTSYTMLIFYESKPSCRVGVNISPTYYSSYPLCTNS